MLLLVLTSYLFVQGPLLWAWHNFFCPLRLFPVFDRLASFDRPRFLRFPKKVMKKVFTHNLKTLSVYSAIQSMLRRLFSLFTFDFNHVFSFPGSACYYAEVLRLLGLHIFWLFFFADRPTDRSKIRERIRQKTKK